MKKLLKILASHPRNTIVFAGFLILGIAIPVTTIYGIDQPGDPFYNPNFATCSGSLLVGGSCSGGGGGTSSTGGNPCTSAANACGATSAGVIHGGICSKKTQTGTNSKGNPTYTYTALNPPALPAGYGTACNSPANSCGTKTAGTITCSGTCSKTTAPANPVGYGTACTSTNACGVSANGTKTCSLTCSAATPALPAGYGTACQSAVNACGMKASGVIQCSGSCSASVPSNNLCAPNATTSLRANPSLVQRGSTAVITWSSSNAASCTVTGTNGNSWSGTSGSRTTTGITDRTTYTLACISVNGKAVTPLTTTVDIVPAFHEF